MRPPPMIAAAWLVAKKALLIELRTRTAFIAAVVFSVTGLAIFYFAWSPTRVGSMDLAPGVVWVVFAFSSVLAVQRSFSIEVADRAGDGLLIAPIERESISTPMPEVAAISQSEVPRPPRVGSRRTCTSPAASISATSL